jgi:Tol biopolymer transport system component
MNVVLRCHLIVLGIALMLIAGGRQLTIAQQAPLGQFDGQADVGPALDGGTAIYDADMQEYVLEGARPAGTADQDAVHVVWTRLTGDFIVRARVAPLDAQNPPRVMGWTARTQLDPSAVQASATVRADGQTVLQFRRADGDRIRAVPSSVAGADVIQLARDGNSVTMSVAQHGDPFTTEQMTGLALGDSVYVGLFVSAGDGEAPQRAAFRNVRIIRPAPNDLVLYEDYLGSNLEVLNVDSGHRRVVHRSDESLQAPNWTPDDEALIYNSNGLLYRFDRATQTADVIDTGFADANNNDHVLSFDGTQMGISHHAAEHDGASIIYTVPTEGGTPTQVTPLGPSYLHGWSPDGQWLTYTGERDGAYDIYKIPVSGGEEVRLTQADGLDDGSEYSPDGTYIYFNSVRSGRMEIWRMRPDGSGKEQLTDDRFNNWFPHVSPDGTRLVFLSYRPDVPPGDHPFYKQVYLRMMPIDGGAPRVVAYVYGGQGTINVPSWSPDGRHIAFVSNTGR